MSKVKYGEMKEERLHILLAGTWFLQFWESTVSHSPQKEQRQEWTLVVQVASLSQSNCASRKQKTKTKTVMSICVTSVLKGDRITCFATQNNRQCLSPTI